MDWVRKLPDKLQGSLQKLLDLVEQHEDSYMNAENASVGQIWTGMALMNQRIEKLEEIVQAQRKALNSLDVDMDKHLDRELEDSLKNY